MLPLLLVLAFVTASPDPWDTGLGRSENACLGFLFEVTFMKIDVAEMEAWLDDDTAVAVAAARASGDDLEDRVAEILLAADEMVIRMEFARDGGFGRMREGMSNNLESGQKQGLVSAAGVQSVLAGLDSMLTPLEEREAQEGDAVLYHLTPGAVRMAYFDPAGKVLFDRTFTDPDWPAGIKSIFLARDSKFREKWGRSLGD